MLRSFRSVVSCCICLSDVKEFCSLHCFIWAPIPGTGEENFEVLLVLTGISVRNTTRWFGQSWICQILALRRQSSYPAGCTLVDHRQKEQQLLIQSNPSLATGLAPSAFACWNEVFARSCCVSCVKVVYMYIYIYNIHRTVTANSLQDATNNSWGVVGART